MLLQVGATAVTSLVTDFWSLPLQAVDPATLLDAPASVRAAVVFLLTVLFGGGVIYRYGSRLNWAVDASAENPLSSTLYGIMAFGVVTFMSGYGLSQFLRIGFATTAMFFVTIAIFAVIILSLSGLGFVIVGCWLTQLVGARDPWLGLVGVGAAGAVVWLLLPVVVGGAVWFIITAVGIGGPARLWLHDDYVKPEQQ